MKTTLTVGIDQVWSRIRTINRTRLPGICIIEPRFKLVFERLWIERYPRPSRGARLFGSSCIEAHQGNANTFEVLSRLID